MSKGLNVHSEIGALKKVCVHRPGMDLVNMKAEDFDRVWIHDAFYLDYAQKEHDQFTDLLRGAGAEVVDFDFLVLAGFLLQIPEVLIHLYPNKIINIHPALLPKYGGKGMYGNRVHEAVVAAGEKFSGITIHYIDAHYDSGSIIFQTTCEVLPTDTPHDVAVKVNALEYQFYPQVIQETINKEFSLTPDVE